MFGLLSFCEEEEGVVGLGFGCWVCLFFCLSFWGGRFGCFLVFFYRGGEESRGD